MARKLLCPNCDKVVSGLAEKYNEFYESVEGNSKMRYLCDDCGTVINVNDKCFVSVLLPDKFHPNYEYQKPESWMDEYITPLQKQI